MMNTKQVLQFSTTGGEFSPKPQGLSNPNHHIWLNNGVWFCHLTVHKKDYTKSRIRISLGTKNVEQARERRDLLFRFAREAEGFVASPSANPKSGLPRHFKHAA